MQNEDNKRVGYLAFSVQRMEMVRNGWLQARYYSDDDSQRVRDFLSYDDVYDVNPYEVGTSHRAARRAFKTRFVEIVGFLGLEELLSRAFVSLSNGETRRVMLARELLKDPEVMVFEDPYNGLDPEQCSVIEGVIKSLRKKGIEVIVKGDHPVRRAAGRWTKTVEELPRSTVTIVDLDSITVKVGRKILYRNFSWRIGEGERWVLRGRNGSGKTTLMALITGDSPLAYGLNVTVFGKRRDIGCDLNAIRRKIAIVSPELQAYSGKTPDELIDEALSRSPKLLILDEPCMNLSLEAARRLCTRVAAWLAAHPKTASICIAHRPEHVPAGFDRELNLDEQAGRG